MERAYWQVLTITLTFLGLVGALLAASESPAASHWYGVAIGVLGIGIYAWRNLPGPLEDVSTVETVLVLALLIVVFVGLRI